MKLKKIKTKIFKEGEDLVSFLSAALPRLKENSVIVLSSKIAALAEGRIVDGDFEKIVKAQSVFALKTKLCYFTVKDGMVMTNAGADLSNSESGKIILLPKDCYKTARRLRAALKKFYGLKNLGVIITDSMILPLRAGVIGCAVGYSGFKGVKNYIGVKDIYGRKLKMTLVNAADSLSAAAALLMGEAAEQTPLCLIEDAPVVFVNKDKKDEIKYPPEKDLYYPFFKKYL